MTDVLLTFLVGCGGGLLAFFATNWTLTRKVTQLEFDLYSLVERVNTEVKRRASAAGKRAKDFDEAILEAAQKTAAQPPAPAAPWWFQYVKQNP